MAFRKTRDTAEHDQPAETEVEGEIREFVRRDVATSLRPQSDSESEMVASNINSVLQRVTGTPAEQTAIIHVRPAVIWGMSAEAHNNLGNALKEQGKLDECIGALTRYGAVTTDGHGETVEGLVLGLRGARGDRFD